MNYERLSNGLIKDFPYVYGEDGKINWKAHLSAKWLRVKKESVKDVESKFGPINKIDLSKLDDWFLYVKLGGYNDIARLRGFDSLLHKVDFVNDQKAVITCTMHFIPNVEDTNGLTCAGVASGSVVNIHPDFVPYMETIAENRAFSRCVRRALNINIVSEEELGKTTVTNYNKSPKEEAPNTEFNSLKPFSLLEKKCASLKINFNSIKTLSLSFRDKLKSNPEIWSDWPDIDPKDIYFLLNKIEEKSK